MTFRDRLIATLRELRPVLEEPGVLVVGSEVPNLLQPAVAATLVVSQAVDVAVPIHKVGAVKDRLRQLRELVPSTDEPWVFVPVSERLIEANFLGLDTSIREPGDTYVMEDPELPLIVFGPLGHVQPGPVVDVEGTPVPLPRPAGLIVEKLLTDRTAEKGARDLLVVAGLLAVAGTADLDELTALSKELPGEALHALRSNPTIPSLMESRPGMPDPVPFRPKIAEILRSIEEGRHR